MGSPLVARLLETMGGRFTRERQELEDRRRREKEDADNQFAQFQRNAAIADFIRQNAGMIQPDAPAPAAPPPAQVAPPPPEVLASIAQFFNPPPQTGTAVPPPAAAGDAVAAALAGAEPPPAPAPPPEAYVPQTATPAPPPPPPAPETPPPAAQAAAAETAKGKKERVMMKLPDGREIPLATLEEQQDWKIKQRRAEADAQSDIMDVPNNPELFGELAGQKGVRTSTVNAVVSALGRKEQIEANRLMRQAQIDYRKGQDDAKKRDEDEGARVTAQAWSAGQAYPTTQKATENALQYMDAHPDEFPRRPKKLGALQQKEVESATFTITTVDEVRKAYEKIKNKVGPWKYQLKELQQRFPGKADPDFAAFNVLLRGMDNLEIKRITGAQMSEAEAGRLLKGMATGDLKMEEFEAALKVMERNAKVGREIVTFGDVRPELTTPIAVPWTTEGGNTGGGNNSTGLTQITNVAEYNALPPGPYLDPKGIRRIKN